VARLRFSLPLAHGLKGSFFECTACAFLHSDHLDDDDALERVYSNADNDADPGAAWRQFCVAKRLRQLTWWCMFGDPRVRRNALDVGSASGFIPAFLAHQLQWNATGYEPYSRPAFTPKLTVSTWEAVAARAPYHLVSASEVIEHFRNPTAEFGRIASVMDRERSFLYVTTGAYDPKRCDEHWPYLATHAAQHCSFYSRGALARVAEVIGASLVLRLGHEAEWLFVRGPLSTLQRVRFRATAAAVRASTLRTDRVG
jgi:hypothetical protein